VVLDDDVAAGDADALGEEAVRIVFVMEDVGEDDDVVCVCVERDGGAVVLVDMDGLVASLESFEAFDDEVLGSGLEEGGAEGSAAAADVEDAIARAEVWRDASDELIES
jgi:hypothetical protein